MYVERHRQNSTLSITLWHFESLTQLQRSQIAEFLCKCRKPLKPTKEMWQQQKMFAYKMKKAMTFFSLYLLWLGIFPHLPPPPPTKKKKDVFCLRRTLQLFCLYNSFTLQADLPNRFWWLKSLPKLSTNGYLNLSIFCRCKVGQSL